MFIWWRQTLCECCANLSVFCHAQPPLNAHWQDSGAWWHPPRAHVYGDKITAAGHWVAGAVGGSSYLGVKTMTNFPLRLRSPCIGVCQRCHQQLDLHMTAMYLRALSVHFSSLSDMSGTFFKNIYSLVVVRGYRLLFQYTYDLSRSLQKQLLLTITTQSIANNTRHSVS